MSRKESPLMFIWDWDGDELVRLEIHCPTATSPQPNRQEEELVRIFNERKKLQADLATAKKEIEELIEFVMSARHSAGCSREFGEHYRCRCGLSDYQKALKENK